MVEVMEKNEQTDERQALYHGAGQPRAEPWEANRPPCGRSRDTEGDDHMRPARRGLLDGERTRRVKELLVSANHGRTL